MSAGSRQSNARPARPADRRGAVLLIVLVVVALLSLAVYTFAELMLTEVESTAMYGRGLQSRAWASSGVELAAAVPANRAELAEVNLYHNPDLFQAVLLREAESPRQRGRFSLAAPLENDPQQRRIRFGLMDESARLNLNEIHRLGLSDEELRDVLMYLPEMTHELADALLDWVDEDDNPREYGAESEYYETLSPPYSAKNGPLESLEELLLVRGVTPWLLFGEDANRNGLLDANENDGDASPPFDDADGLLRLGWSVYLTVSSRETNRRSDGTARINVNQNLLTELYDQLEAELGEEAAQFVTAFRLAGPRAETTSPAAQPSSLVSGGGSGSGSGGGSGQQSRGGSGRSSGAGSGSGPAGGSGGSSGGGSGGGSGAAAQTQAVQQATETLTRALFGARQGGTVTRGGLDLSRGGRYRINSLYELIDAQVEVEQNGTRTVLDSPWSSDPGSMQEYLPQLMDVLTTVNGEFLPGRINVNQARREVLLGLPEMTEALADAIVAAQPVDSTGMPLTDVIAQRTTTGWLVAEGLVTLEQMQRLDRFLTARGDVYRVQSVGYFDAGGPVSRIEAVIDATQTPPRVVFFRELTDLGRGYSPEQLGLGLTLP